MELHLFRATWGVQSSWDEMFARLPDLGYAGVEFPNFDLKERPADVASRHGLRCIVQIFTEGDSVAAHVESFRRQLEGALRFEPVLVNCHDGRDFWSEDEAARYFEGVLEAERDLGVQVAHETHRGRVLFNPWITARMMARFEDLRLCCDFSHWVCVCERLIDDQEDILRRCAERAIHVHARVGYEEGPQVPDPNAPEYARHLAAHERWWDLVWDAQERRGDAFSTLTPEFGPPQYLHTLPHTNVPVADLWEINSWQGRRQADRFAARR